MNNQLTSLSKALHCLHEIPEIDRSRPINQLIQFTKNILFDNCTHEVEEDNIDIDIEKNISISYCKKCELTFSINDIMLYIQASLNKIHQDDWKIYYNNTLHRLKYFFTQNNKIGFSIILNNDSKVVYYELSALITCRVIGDTVRIM